MIELFKLAAITAAVFQSGAKAPAPSLLAFPSVLSVQAQNPKNDRYHAARSLVNTVDRIAAVVRLANKQAHGDQSLKKEDIPALNDEMKVLHKLRQWHLFEMLSTLAKELDADLTAIGVKAADLQLKIRSAEATVDMLNKIAP